MSEQKSGRIGILMVYGVEKVVVLCMRDGCAHSPERCFLCGRCSTFGIDPQFTAGRLRELQVLQRKVNKSSILELLHEKI